MHKLTSDVVESLVGFAIYVCMAVVSIILRKVCIPKNYFVRQAKKTTSLIIW